MSYPVNANELLYSAHVKGFITVKEMLDPRLIEHATERIEDLTWPEDQGYGSSDMNADIFYILKDAGFNMAVEGGCYVRKGMNNE